MAAAASGDLQGKWEYAQSIEKEIRTELKRKDSPPSYEQVDAMVTE